MKNGASPRGVEHRAAIPSGVIRADELYTIDEFKKRLGIKDSTLRAARRAGFSISYLHGRAYILGKDWITYVTNAGRPLQ